MRDTAERQSPASTAPAGGASRLTRRRVLALGTAAALLGTGAATAMLRAGGYAVAGSRTLVALSAWQFVVIEAAARRITASDGAAAPTADDIDVAGFVDAWVAQLAPRVRRDFGRFLAYLEHVAPLGCGFASRFTRLRVEDQNRVLAATEASRNDLLRAGFEGVKSLVFVGYYRDPRTWSIVGYDGPLVDRPPEGWSAWSDGDAPRGFR